MHTNFMIVRGDIHFSQPRIYVVSIENLLRSKSSVLIDYA